MSDALAKAIAKHSGGDARGALSGYEAILKEDPTNARAWHYAGVAQHQLGDSRKAVGCLQRATALDPAAADSTYALGVALQVVGSWDEAFARFERALITRPDFPDAHNGIGAVYQHRGEIDEAEQAYRRALAIEPNHADAMSNLGKLLAGQARFDEAIAVLKQLTEVRPAQPASHWEYGRALRSSGEYEKALVALDRANGMAPDDPGIGYDRALTLLHLGRYREGFAAWECRARRPDMRPRPEQPELWAGQPLGGRRIWLFAEQGQGDLIQYLRYANQLAAQGAHVIAEAHPNLMSIVARAEGVAEVAMFGTSIEADYLVPSLSLPHLFETTIDTVPAAFPYLTPPPGNVPALTGSGRKIGMVWSGNPQQVVNRWRSCAFSDLVPLLELPDTTFFSLQKGSRAADRRLHDTGSRVHDLGPKLTDFGVTARVLQELDLLITTDTAIAHLAGALDRPAYLLLAHHTDWRWGREGSTTPWYRSLRLFRQSAPGDWSSVIANVYSDLSNLRTS